MAIYGNCSILAYVMVDIGKITVLLIGNFLHNCQSLPPYTIGACCLGCIVLQTSLIQATVYGAATTNQGDCNMYTNQ